MKAFQKDAQTYECIHVERHANVCLVRINRPNQRNAINSAVMLDLELLLPELERDLELRCVLLTGSGDRAFVAGGDLKELAELRTHEQALTMNRRMRAILRRLELLDCPVLALINGAAIGGGCELMLAADRRLCAQEATLSFRQPSLGLTCGWGGLTRLERLVGRSRAFEILLLQEELSPLRALELGLVDEVLPRASLLERAMELAGRFASLPPLALRGLKRGLVRVGELPFDQALDYEAELFARTWASSDHWEALKAFTERRQGDFRGE